MATVKRTLAPVLVAVAVVFLTVASVYFYHTWQHWLAYETGSQNNSSTPPNYNYWSGFGSVFPWEIGFVAGIWTGVYQRSKRANCHTHGCWRLGSLPAGDGSLYKVCKRCHYRITGTHPTIEHFRRGHHGRLGSHSSGDSGPGSG